MDSLRFDAISRRLASHRRSRQAALAGFTGVEEPRGPGTAFLFVQVAGGGTWAPKPGNDGASLLTLSGIAAQTVYFSDRPDRIVGTVPTRTFLDSLGFTPADPPNAALVVQTGDGDDVVVVELVNPVYEESFGETTDVSVTYEARVLAGYADFGLAGPAGPAGLDPGLLGAAIPDRFGPASLFIDDCAKVTFWCEDANGNQIGDIGKHGMCWNPGSFACRACRDYGPICNQTFPDRCQAACTAHHGAGGGCAAVTVVCSQGTTPIGQMPQGRCYHGGESGGDCSLCPDANDRCNSTFPACANTCTARILVTG